MPTGIINQDLEPFVVRCPHCGGVVGQDLLGSKVLLAHDECVVAVGGTYRPYRPPTNEERQATHEAINHAQEERLAKAVAALAADEEMNGYAEYLRSLSPEVKKAVEALGVTTVRWEEDGKITHNFKLMVEDPRVADEPLVVEVKNGDR